MQEQAVAHARLISSADDIIVERSCQHPLPHILPLLLLADILLARGGDQ